MAPRSRKRMSYPGMLETTTRGRVSMRVRRRLNALCESERKKLLWIPATPVPTLFRAALQLLIYTKQIAGFLATSFKCNIFYEMEVLQNMIPVICDGEVKNNLLLTLDEVKQTWVKGGFKLNCAR